MQTGEPTSRSTRARGRHLPPAVERKLVEKARRGSAADREALVDAFLPMIGGVARMYANAPRVEREELMQEGVVGLLRALDRYDPELGVPFWGYAGWWVRQAMQQLVSEMARPIVLSDRALRRLAQLKEAYRRLSQANAGEPRVHDLAEATGIPRAQVESLLAVERGARSLSAKVGEDPYGAGATVGDLLPDPSAEDAFERVPRRVLAQRLPSLLAKLSDRERTILGARFGLAGVDLTLREVGKGLGVSAERVRQIEQSALGKLREAATGAV